MKKSDIKVLVITGFGLNCERETAAACKMLGATPELVHLNDLIAGKHRLDEYHFLTFIGGFAFGAVFTRSSPASWALNIASLADMIPSWAPSAPIKRTSLSLICSLIIKLLIVVHLHT